MIKIIKYTLQKTKLTRNYSKKLPNPLRSTKPRSIRPSVQNFIDSKSVRVIGGKGGDGCISFLHLWANERAGPDGGDGGNGAHVIFRASSNVKDLNHVLSVIKGEDGGKGMNKDCCGKNAQHAIVDVPIGTVFHDENGKIIADLNENGVLFVGARGGSGGKGNHYFITDIEQAPKISEYGALGEDLRYNLEIRSIAQIGFIGFPNAGKSTLLQAITRARPKIAPYPFTTLKPHIGMVQFDDYEQIAVADLPGIIPGSHKNKGLGFRFLKHIERCVAFVYVLDVSDENVLEKFQVLHFELTQFNKEFVERPQFIAANKIDLAGVKRNVEILKENCGLEVIPVSGKLGYNLLELLRKFRDVYDVSKFKVRNKG
nr:mitochondrial ribosome-associated GTPase 2 [Onthophagus taurus]